MSNLLSRHRKSEGLHSQSGETVGNRVGNQLPAGWDTRLEWGYFQFLAVAYPESKNLTWLLVLQAVGWRLGTFSVAHRKPRTPVYVVTSTHDNIRSWNPIFIPKKS